MYSRSPFVTLYKRPGLAPPEFAEVGAGSLLEAVAKRWPEGFAPSVPRYYLTHDNTTKIIRPDEHTIVEGEDHVTILLGPGIAPLVLPAWVGWAMIAISLAFTLLMPKPKVPKDDDYTTQASNRLSGQRNEVRVNQRIPDIFGTKRHWPDILIPSYAFYDRYGQKTTELFCDGRGSYQYAEAKLGEMVIEGAAGISLKHLRPYQLASERLIVVRENPNVRKWRLIAPEEAVNITVVTFGFAFVDLITSTQDIFDLIVQSGIFLVSDTTSNNGYFTVSDNKTYYNGSVYYITPEQSVTAEVDTTATFRVGLVVDQEFFVDSAYSHIRVTGDTIEAEYDWQAVQITASRGNYVTSERPDVLKVGMVVRIDPTNAVGLGQFAIIKSVEFTIQYRTLPGKEGELEGSIPIEWARVSFTNIDGSAITTMGSGWTGSQERIVITVYNFADKGLSAVEPNWTPWFTIGTIKEPVNRLIFDVAADAGIYAQRPGRRRLGWGVTCQYEYRKVVNGVPDANATRKERIFWDHIPDTLRWTTEIPLGSDGIWESRYRRKENLRDDNDGTIYQDDITLNRVAGAYPLDSTKYGFISCSLLRIKSNQPIQNLEDRKFNQIQTRELRTLSANGAYGAKRVVTNRMIDALMHTAVSKVMGRMELTEIDTTQLGGLQAALDGDIYGPGMGEVSLNFDRIISSDDQLQVVADVTRCVPYRVGGVLHIARDERHLNATRTGEIPGVALFNRRNILPRGYEIELQRPGPNDPDAILIQWTDPESGYRVRTMQYPTGFTPARPFEMEIPGLANWQITYNRAKVEWEKIRRSRDRLRLQTTSEGILLSPMNKIRVVNLLKSDNFDGEITGFASAQLSLQLDRPVTFQSGKAYTVVLRDPDGEQIDEIGCIAGVDATHVVLSRLPNFGLEILSGAGNQVGTLFSFGPQANHLAQSWQVLSADPQPRGIVVVEARKYDSNIWNVDVDKNEMTLPPDSTLKIWDSGVPF